MPRVSKCYFCLCPGHHLTKIFCGWGLDFSLKFKQKLKAFISIKKEKDPAAAAAKSFQSCLTLCDPRDGSPPGSPIPGILQARTLEWVAMSFCNAWKWEVKVKSLSRVQLLATPWTAASQAPPFMGFSRQEYWSGVPLVAPKLVKKFLCAKCKNFIWHLIYSLTRPQ